MGNLVAFFWGGTEVSRIDSDVPDKYVCPNGMPGGCMEIGPETGSSSGWVISICKATTISSVGSSSLIRQWGSQARGTKCLGPLAPVRRRVALSLSFCGLIRRGFRWIVDLGQIVPFQLVVITAHNTHPNHVLAREYQLSCGIDITLGPGTHLHNVHQNHQVVILQVHRVLRTDGVSDSLNDLVSFEFIISSNRRSYRILHNVRSSTP